MFSQHHGGACCFFAFRRYAYTANVRAVSGTYRSGQAALIGFAARFGIFMDSMADASPASFQFFGRQLALYLRATRGFKAVTISQYISHCQTGLGQVGFLHAKDLRSSLLSTLLRGWFREDIRRLPKRLSMSIPATASVMKVFCFGVADGLYAGGNRKRLEVKACAALTYYLALRATEGAAKSRFLRDSDPDYLSEDAHHLRTGKVFMRYEGDQEFTPICPRSPDLVSTTPPRIPSSVAPSTEGPTPTPALTNSPSVWFR